LTRGLSEGDFDLVASEEYYTCDVHAVTGLLKLWLRELPNNILTDTMLKKVLIIKGKVELSERDSGVIY
jgi:hypothetical protein